MKKILVPVDFTPASRHTAEFAMRLAAVSDKKVQLLHIYKDPIPATVGPEPWTITLNSLRKQKDAQMKEEISFLSQKYHEAVEGDVRSGFKVHSIRTLSKDESIDMIVLGLKAVAGSKSNTITKIIRRIGKPVLVVPEEAQLADLQHIVLAIDFKPLVNGFCFEPLFEIVKAFNASLNVIHVEAKGADSDKSDESARLEIGRMLSKVSYVYDKLENDDTGTAILRYVQIHPADLLVMVARDHPFVWRQFGSHIIDTPLRNSGLPVLILAGDHSLVD